LSDPPAEQLLQANAKGFKPGANGLAGGPGRLGPVGRKPQCAQSAIAVARAFHDLGVRGSDVGHGRSKNANAPFHKWELSQYGKSRHAGAGRRLKHSRVIEMRNVEALGASGMAGGVNQPTAHVVHPVLSVRGVNVAFGNRRILQDVSFSLNRGDFCGLIGANGAGKTTLLRVILGFQSVQSGSCFVDRAVDGSGRLAAIGYVPQKIFLDAAMPLRARDVVALGLDGQRLGLRLPSLSRNRLVDEMLDAVAAGPFADQRVGNLSGGQQQRILIAHALVRKPRLLLLDEPFANLDVKSVAEIVTLLHRLSNEHHITVLASAHDMNALLHVMDRIVYLAKGRAASGRADEVVQSDVLSRLYGHHIDVVRLKGRVLVLAGAGEDDGSNED
jgi:zinc/manganese transport system ATP-binding protein